MKRTFRPKQENLIDPPPGGYANYISFQKIINSNDGGIDENLLNQHIKKIIDEGWEELPVSFDLLNRGDQIRYTTEKDGKYLFRTGGWITAIDEENSPPEWFSYFSHTKSSWCVQLNDCVRIFRKTRKTKVVKKPKSHLVEFNRPGPETNHNVYLVDSDGVEQRVYSAKYESSKKRFESSAKFKKAQEVGWIFKDT